MPRDKGRLPQTCRPGSSKMFVDIKMCVSESSFHRELELTMPKMVGVGCEMRDSAENHRSLTDGTRLKFQSGSNYVDQHGPCRNRSLSG
jgi:hypothetical protein